MKQVIHDGAPIYESKRSQNKRKLEFGDDSDTEDNGLPPVKIQKTNKATKGDIMHNQTAIEIETDIEVDEICCSICETTDDNDIKGLLVATSTEDDDSIITDAREGKTLNRVYKNNTNSKLQTKDDDEKLLQPTNRTTYLYQHNYLDQRVVNNKLYLNSSRADGFKRNVSVPRKPRTTKYVMYDTDRLRCFVSRKETLLKKAEEINTATGCDIYLEMRYEEKPHIYKSETFQDISPSDDYGRSQNKRGKRRLESDDDSDTEDNKLSPVKIPKTLKEHKNSGNRDQTENEMETEGDECVCNICGEYEDDNDDDKGPWVNCDYQYEDLSCCMYTAHVTCLELEEYPQHFLCSEHKE
ncbi:Hypothetical predicted protein [Mytilus galloprovincialis]|uniref:Uncharacterized protein n=1 Tax=Mytilus galloprovincialis TaxID=29158 RepID=A0A8B6C333_MYTGA|nr:Hypothetical predicted protein [Mytilus galloprovincialis]